MSRFIDYEPLHADEINYKECKYLYNEVCCNDSSEYVADYPPQGMCENNKRCKYFEKEDGVIGDKNKI